MSQKTLRELAKFGSGLVAADLATVIWFAYSGLLPITSFGITFDEAMIWPAIIFDAALLVVLVHYSWHIGKIPALRERTYLTIAGIIFGIVAAAHFARVLFQIDLSIMDWTAPHWLSWIAVIATTYLCYMSFRLAIRR